MKGIPDPRTVTIAGNMVASAVSKSHLASLPSSERALVIERGVERLMAAGAYVKDGMLHLPREAA